MTARYLLPCTCGRKIEVETRQAGESVRCACGREQEVPTIRGLKELEQVSVAAPAAKASWTAQQGSLFAGGVALLAIGAAAILYLYLSRGFIDATRPEIDTERILQWAHELTPEDSLTVWNDLSNMDKYPLARSTPDFIEFRNFNQETKVKMVVAAALGGVGLVLALAALVMRPGKG